MHTRDDAICTELCRAACDSPATAGLMLQNQQSPPPPVSALCTLLAMACSNDRRVLQKSPEVLKISLWLESSVGHYVTSALVSLPPVAAVVLAIVRRPEAAIRVITFQVLVFAVCLSFSFLAIGKSLLKGIDESIQQQRERKQEFQRMGATQECGKETNTPSQGRSSGDPMMLAVRNKESEEGGHVRRCPPHTDRVHAAVRDPEPLRDRGTTLAFFHPDDTHPSHLEHRQRDDTSGSNAVVEGAAILPQLFEWQATQLNGPCVFHLDSPWSAAPGGCDGDPYGGTLIERRRMVAGAEWDGAGGATYVKDILA